MWNAEGKMNEKCGKTDWSTSQTMWPQLLRSLPHAARGRCSGRLIMRMWKVAFVHVTVILICHLLQSMFKWKMLRNDINKSYWCVWRCWYPQGLQSIIHLAKHVSMPFTRWCSVKNGWMHNWASFGTTASTGGHDRRPDTEYRRPHVHRRTRPDDRLTLRVVGTRHIWCLL